MFKKRILSGVQPSGDLHLGNYLGAIKNFVALQNDYECLYCIVDLHAITVWQDPNNLAKQTREVAATFIASGIDPDKNIIFPINYRSSRRKSIPGSPAWAAKSAATPMPGTYATELPIHKTGKRQRSQGGTPRS